MVANQLENLIEKADDAAQRKDWAGSIEWLKQALQIDPQHVGVLSGIGQCYLNLGQSAEAIPYFEKSANSAINIPDVHNNLGVAYLVNGDYLKAEISFKEALRLDDDNLQAWKNLAQTYLNQQNKLAEGLRILAAIFQTHPDDTETILQLALCYEIAGDQESARLMLERLLEIEPENATARQVLDNINQSQKLEIHRIARPEHARKLAGLKSLLDANENKPVMAPPPAASYVSRPATPPRPRPQRTAAFYAPDDFTGIERLPSINAYYGRQGYAIHSEEAFSPEHLNRYDYFVFHNPNLSGILVNAVNLCIQSGKRYAVDLNLDFHHIPMAHPAYTQFGPGNPNALRVVEIILGDADIVTTASPTLAKTYQPFCKRMEVALPCWDAAEPWWNRPSPARSTLNIGWLGSKSDLPDLLAVKSPLQRFFEETPQAQWVAGGCEDAYDIFSNLPENRRRFLPPPTGSSLAYLFTNFDILLVPFDDNPFNQSRSDQPLLYAGIRAIPWIASPLRSFEEWQVGGMIARSRNDWYTCLQELAGSPQKRLQVGSAGRQKAEERKVEI